MTLRLSAVVCAMVAALCAGSAGQAVQDLRGPVGEAEDLRGDEDSSASRFGRMFHLPPFAERDTGGESGARTARQPRRAARRPGQPGCRASGAHRGPASQRRKSQQRRPHGRHDVPRAVPRSRHDVRHRFAPRQADEPAEIAERAPAVLRPGFCVRRRPGGLTAAVREGRPREASCRERRPLRGPAPRGEWPRHHRRPEERRERRDRRPAGRDAAHAQPGGG